MAQYVVYYTDSHGRRVAYTTAYTFEQRYKARGRCMQRHGVRSNVHEVKVVH